MNLKSLSNKNPRTLEEFLNENSAEIYDDHLLMIEVKYALCLMYGNIIGFRYQGLKWSLLKNFFIKKISF